jgi:hypothetical protein
MEIAIILISFILLSTNIYSGVRNVIDRVYDKEKVLSIQTIDDEEKKIEEDQTPPPSPKANVDIKVDEDTDTEIEVVQPETNSEWVYPGANIRSENADLIIIDTNDHHQKVTDWYKDKIKSTGGNVTSFVTTAVNGEIKNELEGAGGKAHVEVKIEKSAVSDVTIISISIKAN